MKRARGMVLDVALVLAFGVSMLILGGALFAHFQPAPKPSPVPAVFCPAGLRVTGVGVSGWPDCRP